MDRRLSVATLLVVAFALGACGDMGRFALAPAPSSQSPAKPARLLMPQTPATEKEHDRILASYGGAYDDPALEELITKTVNRLVAASERPDLAYKVTILNSAAVNAFALPTGQLYVTRGLVALASDTSEQAGRNRQSRGQRHGERSRPDGAGPRKVEIDARELLARAGIRG
jgi:predicted Zn-dependent protease